MIQLEIVNGKAAGTVVTARRFPFQIGRAPNVDLSLDDPGVWERHAEIQLHRSREFVLKSHDKALAAVNSQPVTQAVLYNGDLIDLGAARLRFGLSPASARRLNVREAITWIGLALVFVVQLGLIYWLIE